MRFYLTTKHPTEILKNCSAPGSGCFADDPEAYAATTNSLTLRPELSAIATSAMDAGATGQPLNEAIYLSETPDLMVTGFTQIEVPGFGAFDVVALALGEPRARRIGDLEAPDGKHGLEYRVAKCAYVCEAAALGCPLLSSEQPTLGQQ